MADEEMLMLCTLMYLTIIVAICAYSVDRDKYKGRRKMWVKPWILYRKVKGAYHMAAIIAHVVAECRSSWEDSV